MYGCALISMSLMCITVSMHSCLAILFAYNMHILINSECIMDETCISIKISNTTSNMHETCMFYPDSCMKHACFIQIQTEHEACTFYPDSNRTCMKHAFFIQIRIEHACSVISTHKTCIPKISHACFMHSVHETCMKCA